MQIIEISEPGHKGDKEEIAVGIDFGTTNSLISICENGEAKIIPDSDGMELIPSVVSFSSLRASVNERGNPASRTDKMDCRVGLQLLAGDAVSISSIKRLFGKSKDEIENSPAFPGSIKKLLDKNSSKVKLNILGELLTPVEIAAKIFARLKQNAESYLKTKVEKAVVTMPAYFDDAAKAEVMLAARLAGFNVLRLLAEPTAAAYAYGINKKVTGTYVVYDLGGGTFDVSVLNMEKGVIQVVAIGGDNMLGGDDIDLLIKDFITGKYNLQGSDHELLLLAREVKKHLSYEEKFSQSSLRASKRERGNPTLNTYKMDCRVGSNELLAGDKSIEIDRATLENLIAPLIERTIKITREVWTKEVNAIILVGGSTRIPFVRKLLEQNFNTKILSDIDPDKIIAQGAAYQAENLTKHNGMLLIDAVPLSIGLELYGGLVEKIIERNSPLPTSVTKEYTTYVDNQHSIRFHIVQGEREFARDCRGLAKFELGPLAQCKAGSIKVEVTFALDADGILSVSALDPTACQSHIVQIKPSFGLEGNEINNILENAYKNATIDHQNMLLQEKIIESESFIKHLENILKIMDNTLEIGEKTKISDAVSALQNSLTIKDLGSVEEHIEMLKRISDEILNDRLHSKIADMLKGQKINDY
jgi:molecular chaperone HscA